MENILYFKSLVGELGILEQKNYIVNIIFKPEEINSLNVKENETSILKDAKFQINEYFLKKRRYFDIPIKLYGTRFQLSVWSRLKEIPYGKTKTYKQIATEVGNSKASRAIGNANNKNRIPIIIPCHRVIGSSGNLTGYRGGLHIKKILLDLENSYI